MYYTIAYSRISQSNALMAFLLYLYFILRRGFSAVSLDKKSMHSHTLLFSILEKDVLPSSSPINFSTNMETCQKHFKLEHEKENNFNKPPN